jgi:hypothetical protein
MPRPAGEKIRLFFLKIKRREACMYLNGRAKAVFLAASCVLAFVTARGAEAGVASMKSPVVLPAFETGPQRTALPGIGDLCNWDAWISGLRLPDVAASLPPEAPSEEGIQCPIDARQRRS